MKKLAIFDLDGTLQDSSPVIANAINYVRSRLELPPLDPERIIRKVNDPHLDAAEYFYETDHFQPRHEEWFSEYYSRHHTEEIRLYEGIRELLEWLKARGCLLAVATNAYRRAMLESLRHLGIEGVFDALVGYDDVERGKPSPDMLWKILEELKVDPEEAIFIGDGPRDALAAERAGIDFVLVNWGFSDHKEAVESVEELKKVLSAEC
ncbi:HAD family hydrolase [Nitratifractor sp.]